MHKLVVAVAVTLGCMVVGCSSSSGSGASCGIEGTYLVTPVQITDNTCTDYGDMVGGDEFTAQVLTDDQGNLVLLPQGVKSSSCQIKPRGCKVDDACTYSNGSVVQFSWNFTASGFEGTTVATLPALITQDGIKHAPCSFTETDKGTRR